MNVGLKLYYDDQPFFEKFKDHVDFFEVEAFPRFHFDFLNDYDMPFVVHAPMWAQGVNLANPEREEVNVANMRHAQEVADRLDAKYIIVHPHLQEHAGCNTDNTAKFIKALKDKRIIVENMPFLCSEYMGYLYSAEKMKEFKKKHKINFCLDFAHASEAAEALHEEQISFLRRFVALKPVHYHLSDTKIKTLTDLHLHLREGDLQLNEIKKLIPQKAFVTLEVKHHPDKAQQDLEFMRL